MPGNGLVSEPGASPGEVAALHQRIAEQMETIRDLRVRLDAEAGERRKVQAQLTGLLTDQRAPAAEEPPPLREALADAVAAERIAADEAAGLRAEVERLTAEGRRPWWRRWLR